MMQVSGRLISLCVCLLAGCSVINKTANNPLAEGGNSSFVKDASDPQENYVALAFSGGGMRATSFGHGMLLGLQEASATPDDSDGILSEVRLVTGVSGGSVAAANFGFFGPRSVNSFRDRFLIKNGEKYMANSPFNPLTIARGLSGGANGVKTFGRFLDEALFKGATFGDLAKKSNITTWINAADVANQSSFLFSPETFDALCSDLSTYPISQAVSASAAFPLVFAPVVLKAHADCNYQEPDWLTSARFNPEATSVMRNYGQALESYSDGKSIKYLKLLDGGITDNFGTVGLAVARAKSQNAYAPLSKAQALKMKRMLFLVSDAGTEQDYRWSQRPRGPGGLSLGMAIVSSAMGSATRSGFDAMRLFTSEWEKDLIEYRCSLSRSEVARIIGTTKGWKCDDVKFFVGQVSFNDASPDMREKLNKIPTRLKLKEEEVDLAIEAGRSATLNNPEVRGFLLAGKTPLLRIGSTTKIRRITPDAN